MTIKMEMLVRLNVDGTWRYPGDIIEVPTEQDASDMTALHQAKRLPALLTSSVGRSMEAESPGEDTGIDGAPHKSQQRGKYKQREMRAAR